MLLRRYHFSSRSWVGRIIRLLAISFIFTYTFINIFPVLITLNNKVNSSKQTHIFPRDLKFEELDTDQHVIRHIVNAQIPALEGPMRQLHAKEQSQIVKRPDAAAPARNLVSAGEDQKLVLDPMLNQLPLKTAGNQKIQTEAPCAWVPYTRTDTIRHYIIILLKRFGYSIRHKDEDFTACSLIWTYDYPFWEQCWSQTLFDYSTRLLRNHQKINHFPGIGYVANKASLARFECQSCPTAFLIPADVRRFRQFVSTNANWTWVIKNEFHRGVKIIKPEELTMKDEEMFIQAFISNPLLIDARKFDISVYVALTSINPLRVYMYDADWAARFCTKNYLPFNASDTMKYVVYGTDHTPIWEMKSLKKYWDLGYGFKKSLFIYLQKLGYDTDKLEQSVHEVIRNTFVRKERRFMDAIRNVFSAQNHTRDLFELVRFDFLVDENLRLYLMEANMSPDLSIKEGSQRGQLYKNMLHDLFTMVGIGKVVNGRASYGSHEDYDLLSFPGDLRVFLKECFSEKCANNCEHEICHICTQCLKPSTTANLLHGFMEHAQRHGFRRVVPAPFKSPAAAKSWKAEDDEKYQHLSPENKIMSTWFRGKCVQDITWCN